MFPGEDDRADMRPLCREPVRQAVGQEEERPEQAEPGDGAAPRPRLRSAAVNGIAHHSAQAAPPTRSASDTVKMPHSSMRCSTFSEPGGGDELVHLGLRAAAHDPGLAAAMAGQRAGDQLELRMPGLAGVDQIAARRDGGGQPGERAPHHRVVGEQLVKPGDDGRASGAGSIAARLSRSKASPLTKRAMPASPRGRSAPCRRRR